MWRYLHSIEGERRAVLNLRTRVNMQAMACVTMGLKAVCSIVPLVQTVLTADQLTVVAVWLTRRLLGPSTAACGATTSKAAQPFTSYNRR